MLTTCLVNTSTFKIQLYKLFYPDFRGVVEGRKELSRSDFQDPVIQDKDVIKQPNLKQLVTHDGDGQFSNDYN